MVYKRQLISTTIGDGSTKPPWSTTCGQTGNEACLLIAGGAILEDLGIAINATLLLYHPNLQFFIASLDPGARAVVASLHHDPPPFRLSPSGACLLSSSLPRFDRSLSQR